ncbi:MAG: response regulator transcription factor [Chloroflexota bacterium]
MNPDVVAPVGGRILVVEDEPAFGDLIATWLDQHGFRPIVAHDGLEAVGLFESEQPDLILLDLALPGLDGWEVIRRIRETSGVPIIVVTARGAVADKVRGLVEGADDYMTKPVSFPELIARVRAALRRSQAFGRAGALPEIRFPGLVIDERGHRVVVEGHPVHLTPTEYRLIRHLAERPDTVVSRRALLIGVWGTGYGDDVHLLRVTMRNLRAKLAAAAPGRRFISTSYGLGYRLNPGRDDPGP